MAAIAGVCILYLVAILLCFTSPLLVRVFIFLVNLIMPDPMPLADELLMGAGVISKIQTTMRVIGFIRFIGTIIGIALILGVISIIIYFIFW